MKRDGVWLTWTFQQYYEQVERFAKALIKIGQKPLESTTILGFNSPGITLHISSLASFLLSFLRNNIEWFFADVGTILAGGVASGIYISFISRYYTKISFYLSFLWFSELNKWSWCLQIHYWALQFNCCGRWEWGTTQENLSSMFQYLLCFNLNLCECVDQVSIT